MFVRVAYEIVRQWRSHDPASTTVLARELDKNVVLVLGRIEEQLGQTFVAAALKVGVRCLFPVSLLS